MWEEVLKAIPIYFFTMLKFIVGPMGGYAAGFNLITTILISVASLMTVVLAFTFFGDFIRNKIIKRFFPRKKKFSDKSRRVVTIWKKYGMVGVAALTPCLLTPIGGTLIAISFGAPRNKLILYMFISGSFWAVLFSVVIYFFGNEFLPEVVK